MMHGPINIRFTVVLSLRDFVCKDKRQTRQYDGFIDCARDCTRQDTRFRDL